MLGIVVMLWLALLTALIGVGIWWVRYRAANVVMSALVRAAEQMVCKTCGNVGMTADLKPCPDCEFGKTLGASRPSAHPSPLDPAIDRMCSSREHSAADQINRSRRCKRKPT